MTSYAPSYYKPTIYIPITLPYVPKPPKVVVYYKKPSYYY